jgi:CheY-like chemotaxis protein
MTATNYPVLLLADDNALIREALGAALRRRGLRVLLAANGAEAMDQYRMHATEISVVLLDVRMPGMDGPQTLTHLRERNPDLACCFMTGESDDDRREELLNMGASHLFVKPFGVAEVMEVLQSGLAQA